MRTARRDRATTDLVTRAQALIEANELNEQRLVSGWATIEESLSARVAGQAEVEKSLHELRHAGLRLLVIVAVATALGVLIPVVSDNVQLVIYLGFAILAIPAYRTLRTIASVIARLARELTH